MWPWIGRSRSLASRGSLDGELPADVWSRNIRHFDHRYYRCDARAEKRFSAAAMGSICGAPVLTLLADCTADEAVREQRLCGFRGVERDRPQHRPWSWRVVVDSRRVRTRYGSLVFR